MFLKSFKEGLRGDTNDAYCDYRIDLSFDWIVFQFHVHELKEI